MRLIRYVVRLILCLVSGPAVAQALVWNFGTDAANPSPSSDTVGHATAGDVSQGNNNGTTALLTTVSASGGYAGASGQFNAGAAARTGALNTDANGSAYFAFTVTPDPGYTLVVTAIAFGTRSTPTGPQAYTLRGSLDGYASDLATGAIVTNSSWALKQNTLAVTSTVADASITFRLYGHDGVGNANAGTANWRIDDLMVAVPPPALVALPATAVADGRFVANWVAVDGAAGYRVDLIRVIDLADAPAIREREGFDAYPDETPAGWTILNGSTKTYTTAGNFGEEAPSVRLDDTGQSVLTPVYAGAVTNLSFWYRGQGVTDSTLLVEGSDGVSWRTIDTVAVSNSGTTQRYALDGADGYTQFRLTYNKVSGNMGIDDITVDYVERNRLVVQGLDVGAGASHRFQGLEGGVYDYQVWAVNADGERVSEISARIRVEVPNAPIPTVTLIL